MNLQEKLNTPFWKGHVIGNTYSMKNRDLTTEICKIVYYPLGHEDPTALIEISKNGFNDFREVPIRFLSPFYQDGVISKKTVGKYVVYSDGRIWSNAMNRFISANKLKDKRRKYIGVWMNGKHKRLHRVIAEAFIENPNNYPEINHINGDPADNRVENLEWCNPSMNQKHAYKTGLHKPMNGETNHQAKLSGNMVLIIRECLEAKFTGASIARYFKISQSVISSIRKGRTWKTV